MNRTTNKSHKRGKKQQGAMLPVSVVAWLGGESRRTGASISRTVQTAIVAYSELDATDRAAAMADAMMVEAGEKTI